MPVDHRYERYDVLVLPPIPPVLHNISISECLLKSLINYRIPCPQRICALTLGGVQCDKTSNERKGNCSEPGNGNRNLLLVSHFIGVTEMREFMTDCEFKNDGGANNNFFVIRESR